MQTKKIIVKTNEEKVVPYIWINGDDEELSYDAEMLGDGGDLHILGLFLGTESRSITFNTSVVHKGKNTKSRTTIRGVFLDTSSFSNDGLVRINNGAKNADGYFSSKILLFDEARGRSVPSLEIDENELKAGHASTVGKPDAEQIFYMKSRGISEDEAQMIIIEGFFDPILKLIPDTLREKTKVKIKNMLLV